MKTVTLIFRTLRFLYIISYFCHTLCPVPIRKQIPTCKLRSVDYDNFEADILTAAEEIIRNDNLEDLIDNYDKLSNILEKHAPVVTKTVTVCCEVPWFNVKAKELKAKKCRPERNWSRPKTCENRNYVKETRNKYRYHLNHSKYQCINNQIRSCGSDTTLYHKI